MAAAAGRIPGAHPRFTTVSASRLGAWCPKIGLTKYAITCAVRGVLSGAALRRALRLTTTSNGDFTLLRKSLL